MLFHLFAAQSQFQQSSDQRQKDLFHSKTSFLAVGRKLARGRVRYNRWQTYVKKDAFRGTEGSKH